MLGRSMLKTPRIERARAVTERVAAGCASPVAIMTSVMLPNVKSFSLNEKVISRSFCEIGFFVHVFRDFWDFGDFCRAFTQ
jgi:hypothetical protein